MAPRKAQNAAPSTTTSTTRMTRARSKAACAQPVQIGGSFLSREADEDFKEFLPPKKKRKTAAPATISSLSTMPTLSDESFVPSRVFKPDIPVPVSQERLSNEEE